MELDKVQITKNENSCELKMNKTCKKLQNKRRRKPDWHRRKKEKIQRANIEDWVQPTDWVRVGLFGAKMQDVKFNVLLMVYRISGARVYKSWIHVFNDSNKKSSGTSPSRMAMKQTTTTEKNDFIQIKKKNSTKQCAQHRQNYFAKRWKFLSSASSRITFYYFWCWQRWAEKLFHTDTKVRSFGK